MGMKRASKETYRNVRLGTFVVVDTRSIDSPRILCFATPTFSSEKRGCDKEHQVCVCGCCERARLLCGNVEARRILLASILFARFEAGQRKIFEVPDGAQFPSQFF